MNSTVKPRRARLTRAKLASYGIDAGAVSFRHGLSVCERGVIDEAVSIIERCIKSSPAFDTPDAVKEYLQLQLGAEPHEIFGVLFLDVQNRFIAFDRMFPGTLTQTSVYPREVVLAALAHKASGVVLTHNHPSGNVMPSRADEMLTRTLKTTLALIDVRVLDHIIVAPGEALSMAERGMM
ncbi:JAB domain-containing protein [Rhodoferax fermentans]|uniref:JAB domain-containing protein n=1 Tax=Rhodoferax fermentans TaxID=28066 RepID=UPI001FD37B2A|nr:JAB domain-containing protein [Rhodoferax fermentans]